MKCWDYVNGVPWVSVKLLGKRKVWEWALIDTGASLCVLHPKFASALGLEKREEYYPEKVPKVIIGRNFLNKYLVTLNGEKICIKRKGEIK